MLQGISPVPMLDSMPDRVYAPPPDLDRASIERLLSSSDPTDQVSALHAALFREPDDEWVLHRLLERITAADPTVRYAATSFTSSFIGMRRSFSPGTRGVLEAAKKHFPDLAPAVDDALDELSNQGA